MISPLLTVTTTTAAFVTFTALVIHTTAIPPRVPTTPSSHSKRTKMCACWTLPIRFGGAVTSSTLPTLSACFRPVASLRGHVAIKRVALGAKGSIPGRLHRRPRIIADLALFLTAPTETRRRLFRRRRLLLPIRGSITIIIAIPSAPVMVIDRYRQTASLPRLATYPSVRFRHNNNNNHTRETGSAIEKRATRRSVDLLPPLRT